MTGWHSVVKLAPKSKPAPVYRLGRAHRPCCPVKEVGRPGSVEKVVYILSRRLSTRPHGCLDSCLYTR